MPDNLGFFAGLRGTGNYGADERPKNFREMILFLNPNGTAPLFALTAKGKTDKTDDPQFYWWEEVNTVCRVQLNGAIASGAVTTFVVDAGALQLIPGDVLQVELAVEVAGYANELVRVVSVSLDTTFVVQRGVAGTTAGAIADNINLTRVGNAQSEGNVSIASSSTNPVKLTNYTQIFKTPYQITNTDLETRHRTGDPRKNEQKRKSFQHAEKIEQALFWGVPFETVDAANGNMPLRFTMGLRNFITSFRTVFTVDPTAQSFLDAIYPVFNYESGEAGNERIIFAGNVALNMLNTIVLNSPSTFIKYDGIVDFFGMRLQRYVIPQGTLYIKSHPLLNVHPFYNSSMWVVNPAGIKYRPLGGRDTKLEKDIQPNDADYTKDQWLTECGFEFHFERTFAYLGQFRDFP